MFGGALRSLRRSLQLTQAALGLRVGVHGCTVGRWEREVHRPRQHHADRLAALAAGETIGPTEAARRRPAPKRRQAPQRVPAASTGQAEHGAGWTLHRGDCFDVVPSLPEGFDALITDPPYCSGGLHLGTRQQSTRRKYEQNGVLFRRQDFDGDQRDQVSFMAWLGEALRRGHSRLRRGGFVAIFSDWRQLGATQTAMQAAGFVMRGIAVWDKTEGARPVPSRLRNQAEFILWGSKGDLVADRSVPTQAGVLRHAVRSGDKFHLTGKPTDVMRWLVRQVRPGGRILDPFAGSGTTGVAALLEGRSFCGVELDPYYARVASLRLSAAERGQTLHARRLSLPAAGAATGEPCA